MGIELLAGSPLQEDIPQESILISEKAMENLGYANPEDGVGQKITFYINSIPSEIQGVFKNFHQRSPKEAYLPLILYRGDNSDNFIVKLNTSDSKMAIDGLQNIWAQVYPDYTFDYYFMNDTYNAQYQQGQQFAKTVFLFTLLSVKFHHIVNGISSPSGGFFEGVAEKDPPPEGDR
jgi:putative ABC transport system permease protein